MLRFCRRLDGNTANIICLPKTDTERSTVLVDMFAVRPELINAEHVMTAGKIIYPSTYHIKAFPTYSLMLSRDV